MTASEGTSSGDCARSAFGIVNFLPELGGYVRDGRKHPEAIKNPEFMTLPVRLGSHPIAASVRGTPASVCSFSPAWVGNRCQERLAELPDSILQISVEQCNC